MDYRITFARGGQQLPSTLLLTDSDIGAARQYGLLGREIVEADYAVVSDDKGNLIEHLQKLDRNPFFDGSSVDWGSIVLPAGEVPPELKGGLE